jgi:hypothetical protein
MSPSWQYCSSFVLSTEEFIRISVIICTWKDADSFRPLIFNVRTRGSLVVKALGYKPEGRGF